MGGVVARDIRGLDTSSWGNAYLCNPPAAPYTKKYDSVRINTPNIEDVAAEIAMEPGTRCMKQV